MVNKSDDKFSYFDTVFEINRELRMSTTLVLRRAVNNLSYTQGCPQDVKSQDRDETETFQKPRRSRPRLHPCLYFTVISLFANSQACIQGQHVTGQDQTFSQQSRVQYAC